jgi:two-component system sensor histidine kinase KdpD
VDRSRAKRILTLGSGYPIAVVVIASLTVALVPIREDTSVGTSLSLYLLGVVATTALAGRNPGLLAAVISPGVANWFIIPPYHTFRINSGENIVELIVFVSVSTIVSAFVSLAARRAKQAARAEHESRALARLAELSQFDSVDQIVELIGETFSFDKVTLVVDGETLDRDATIHDVAPGVVLATEGAALDSDDVRLLHSFIAQLGKSIEEREMRRLALEAESLSRADELRTAILRSVSHDLRTPLANIKAAVSSLRQDDVAWTEDAEDEFLASIENDTDRLTRLITNLLDLGRLEAGVLTPIPRPMSIGSIIEVVVADHGDPERLDVRVPHDLPDVRIDAALVERALDNLVGNALKYSPAGAKVTVTGRAVGDEIEICVIDNGPGIPASQHHVVIRPFHRLDDTKQAGGLGLGLAIADRLLAAVGGRLELRETPGGGLTTATMLPMAEVPT